MKKAMNHITDILSRTPMPFKIVLSFGKLIEQLEKQLSTGSIVEQSIAQQVLDNLQHKSELSRGIAVEEHLDPYLADIDLLMDTVFPSSLTTNEIKVAVAPINNKILRQSQRAKSIFKEHQHVDIPEMKDLSPDELYIYMCNFILKAYYQQDLKSKIPPVYEVMGDNGIINYYKSGHNADFIQLAPIGEAPVIDAAMIKRLEEHYNDIDLWKKVFPVGSWLLSGFMIHNYTPVNVEEAQTRIKNLLISNLSRTDQTEFQSQMSSYLSTYFDTTNVQTMFTMYDEHHRTFVIQPSPYTRRILGDTESCSLNDMLCGDGQDHIFKSKDSLIISDLSPEDAAQSGIKCYEQYAKHGVRSLISTPIYDEDELLGVMQFLSETPGAFGSKHLIRIEKLLALCTSTIKKYIDELAGQKARIIQNEFTAIHSSVEWKFDQEATNLIQAQQLGEDYNIDQIKFSNLIALYGQMDISGSSTARNKAIAADLKHQIEEVRKIIHLACQKFEMPLLQNLKYQIGIIYEKLSSDLAAGMEQEVVEFLTVNINPLFEQLKNRDLEVEAKIKKYQDKLPNGLDIIYEDRKAYDDTVMMINLHLSGALDKAQQKAQKIYPHYFERFKTDGVEHNMYIGQEIAPNLPYNPLYLNNLRLWQLQCICELELEHHVKKNRYPLPLDVASLIMVYSNPLSIRYRMDEKQFDVDGAYNARYEIIKKRIDKAHIKGTNERITAPGKIIIIYTQPGDLEEYQGYINYLTYQGYLTGETELFDIENLQGVTGLKGLRVTLNYDRTKKESAANLIRKGELQA